jgi:PPP family 3-phenylpropionic acid transporter
MYFIYFLALSLHWSYRNVFLKEFGISNLQLGSILMLLSIVVLFSQIIWGIVADNFGRKKILLIQLLSLMIFLFLFGTSPSVTFAVVFLYLMSFFAGNIVSVMDSITLSYLESKRNRYGKIRVFGSIGWAIGNGIAALLVFKVGMKFLMASSAFFLVPVLISYMKIKDDAVEKSINKQKRKSKNTLLPVLKNRGFLFLLITNVIVFTGFQSVVIFMPVYISDVLNMKWLVGISLFVAGLFEIIGMRNEEALSKKIGRTVVIGIGFSAMTAKILLISFAKDIWGVLLAQTLEMFVWGMFYPASVIMIGNLVSAEVLSTAQSLFASSFTVISVIIGSFLGGLIADYLGMVWMFRIMSLISLTGVVIFFAFKNRYLPPDFPKEMNQ